MPPLDAPVSAKEQDKGEMASMKGKGAKEKGKEKKREREKTKDKDERRAGTSKSKGKVRLCLLHSLVGRLLTILLFRSALATSRRR